jgi:ribose transport system substrate-binding protein
MKFSLGKALSLVAVLAFLAGCGDKGSSGGSTDNSSATTGSSASSSGSGEKTKIAFVTNNSSDYWTIARKGVEKAEKELPDYDVQFIMPGDGKAATQKSEVEDQLANGCKAIAISPIDPKNQTDWLNSVAGKAVLLTQDSDATDSKRVCYIGTDNHAAGLMAGGLIKDALGPAGGKIMLFVGQRDAQNAHDREQGIRDALKGTNITIVDVRTDDADHGRAKSNAADALVSNPDLAAEVGLWSYNGPAILSAVTEAGKVGKVKIVCFDEEKDTLAGIASGAIYATVVQQPYEFGYEATKMMASLVKGDKSRVPANGTNYIPTQAITKANVADYQAKMEKLRNE